MAKTALQFRHNGRDVAVFVDGGANLLTTLRDLVGDMTPKFGCGQGGCGACTVLIDGDAHLSCLTLAETVEGRSVETLDGLKDGPNLHPLQRAFMEHFAAQCGYCTPGMLMAAKALLDHNPTPTRDEVVNAIAGQHLPLHRIRTHHQRRARRRLGRPRARLRTAPCWNCARTFSPTSVTTISRRSARAPSARTCSAMSPAPPPISTTTNCRACCI